MKLIKDRRQVALGAAAVVAGTVGGGFTTLAQRLMTVGGGGGGGLILDQLTSVTPVAVFSTRKLLAAYAGNAMHVTAVGGGSNGNVGFDGSNNLNATTLGTLISTHTGTVDTWYDQSGNGNNATAFTGFSQPLPLIRVSGTTTLLGTQAALSTSAPNSTAALTFTSAISTPSTVTIACCFRLNNLGALGAWTDGTATSWRYLIQATSGPVYSMYNFGATGTGGTPDATTTHTMVATFDNAGTALGNLYIDNSLTVGPTAINAASFLGGQVLFGDQFGSSMEMNCGEMFFCTGIMSSGDRGTYHTNCQTYWGSA